MKNFILLIMLISFYSCTNNYKKFEGRNDWTKENLKGRVKSIKTFYCDNTDSSGNVNGIKKEFGTIIFNENGKIIETTNKFDMEGVKYEYDNSSLLVKEVYSDNNFIFETYSIKYIYNKNGKKTDGFLYNRNGELENKYVYNYDLKGNLVEQICYDANGVYVSLNKYKFDNYGNEIQDKYYDLDSVCVLNNTQKFDSSGNQLEFCQYDSKDSLTLKETNCYDINKNMIESIIYNLSKNPIEIESKINFKYILDQSGNWVKQITFINNIPKSLRIREIEYYK